MDRGFCTTANVEYMHSTHLAFVMGVEIRHKTTREAIDQMRGDISAMGHRIKP